MKSSGVPDGLSPSPILDLVLYDIYINEKVPSNDGGIALGQMAVALTRYLQENDIEIVK